MTPQAPLWPGTFIEAARGGRLPDLELRDRLARCQNSEATALARRVMPGIAGYQYAIRRQQSDGQKAFIIRIGKPEHTWHERGREEMTPQKMHRGKELGYVSAANGQHTLRTDSDQAANKVDMI